MSTISCFELLRLLEVAKLGDGLVESLARALDEVRELDGVLGSTWMSYMYICATTSSMQSSTSSSA